MSFQIERIALGCAALIRKSVTLIENEFNLLEKLGTEHNGRLYATSHNSMFRTRKRHTLQVMGGRVRNRAE